MPSDYESRELLRTKLEDSDFKAYGRWYLDTNRASSVVNAGDIPGYTPLEDEAVTEIVEAPTDLGLIFERFGGTLSPEEKRNYAAIRNCVYAFVQCDELANPLEVLYVGKAELLNARMLGHRSRNASTRRFLRSALENGDNIVVYYRDNQPSRTEYTLQTTRVLERTEPEFQVPSFHIHEIAFIRFFNPPWNFYTYR